MLSKKRCLDDFSVFLGKKDGWKFCLQQNLPPFFQEKVENQAMREGEALPLADTPFSNTGYQIPDFRVTTPPKRSVIKGLRS
jgi:hypothetical protein